jgi:hypothetical protein
MLMTLVEIGRWVAFIGSVYLLGGLLFECVRRWLDQRKSRQIREEAERMRAEYLASLERGYVPPITITTTAPPEKRGSE